MRNYRENLMEFKLTFAIVIMEFKLTFAIVIFDILTSHRIIGFGNIYAY